MYFTTDFKSFPYLVSTRSDSKVAAQGMKQIHSNERPYILYKWNADLSKFKSQEFSYWKPGMAGIPKALHALG